MSKKNNDGNWFNIDRAGLAKILRQKGVEFAVFELIQNAWDEAGVTRVDVTLVPAKERGFAVLTVEDNSTDGFSDLRHAYTLFAESAKKGNVQQRGRYNLGEKLVLSLCKWATIVTTKGTVEFDQDGRHESLRKRDHGTVFQALIEISAAELKTISKEIDKLLPPAMICTTFNGRVIAQRDREHQVKAILPTVIADDEGNLRRSKRSTMIYCYPVSDGEKPLIYEMGIPVVEHDCAWHCDVQQKVPLTLDRENVTVKFLRYLRVAVFNATHKSLDVEQVNAEWTQTAIESPDVTPEAVVDYMTKRFGEDRASFDMSDKEANSQAVAHGHTIVHGSMLSKAAWANVRAAEAVKPAGQLFPTNSENVIGHESVDPTAAMTAVSDYAKKLARMLLDREISVVFCKQASRERASWCHGVLSFNVYNLGGAQWFDLKNNRREIDDLIIHEFGHHFESNHLSEAYNDALSRLASLCMALGREGKLP